MLRDHSCSLDDKNLDDVKSCKDLLTVIYAEVMATSTICNQNSVRICSLAVYMNNTDESFFFTVGVLKLLTFSLYKMLEM
jgi:hypothetical protein